MAIGFTRKALAEHLETSVRYVEELDARREGPPRVKIGGKWIYPFDGVNDWLQARIQVQCNAPNGLPDSLLG